MYKTRTIPLLKRLIPSLHKRSVRVLWRGGQGVVRREGALFLLNLQYCVDRFILLSGVDEPEQRAFFFDNLRSRKCDTFVDVGANIGTYTVFAGLETDCSTIFAFEPSQKCYDRLRTHLMLNGLTEKVKTKMAAVSDHNGTVQFEHCPDNTDLFSKVAQTGAGVAVPAVRLDDELPVTGRRIAIKMDIEGHEMVALEGMKALLQNNDCFLQVECWEEHAKGFVAAMDALGYRNIHHIGFDYYFAQK